MHAERSAPGRRALRGRRAGNASLQHADGRLAVAHPGIQIAGEHDRRRSHGRSAGRGALRAAPPPDAGAPRTDRRAATRARCRGGRRRGRDATACRCWFAPRRPRTTATRRWCSSGSSIRRGRCSGSVETIALPRSSAASPTVAVAHRRRVEHGEALLGEAWHTGIGAAPAMAQSIAATGAPRGSCSGTDASRRVASCSSSTN